MKKTEALIKKHRLELNKRASSDEERDFYAMLDYMVDHPQYYGPSQLWG